MILSNSMGYKYIVPDIAPSMERQFQRVLEKQKMKFMLRTKVANVDTSGDIVKLTLEPAVVASRTYLKLILFLSQLASELLMK